MAKRAEKLHTKMNDELYEDELIVVRLKMFHGPYNSSFDNITARVEHIEWEGRDQAMITAKLIGNHRELDLLANGLSLEDTVIDVYGVAGSHFEEELFLPDDFAESLFYSQDEAKKKRERKTARKRAYEEACIDTDVASIVCHTGPGIKTRRRFYPTIV